MKKLFAIFMSVLMIACFMPTMAFAETGGELTNYITVNDEATKYSTFSDAVNAAAQKDGNITYQIYGKMDAQGSDQWINFVKNRENVTSVKFVGMTDDAEVSVASSQSILGVQGLSIDVSFEHLKLTHPNGAWVNDLGHATNYFSCMVRDAKNNTVTYTDCVFPNGVCDNMYGKTVFTNCKFTNLTSGKYNLWNYGGNTTVTNCEFSGTRGIKLYNEGTKEKPPTISVKDTNFTGLTEKPAFVASKPANIGLENTAVTGCEKGLLIRDITGGDELKLNLNGTNIGATFDITAATTSEDEYKSEIKIAGGTFTSSPEKYLDSILKVVEQEDGTFTVAPNENAVAQVGSAYYATLQEAVAAVEAGPAKQFGSNATTITLLKDTNAGLDIGDSQGKTPKNIILDLNNNTLTLGPAVGSKNTETNGIRTLAYSQTEIKNGKIVCSDIMNDKGNYVMCGLANYGKLTLDNVYVQSSNHVQYTINNRGELTLKGKTTVEAGSYGTGDFQDLAIANEVYNAYYENQRLNAKVICDSKDVTVGKMSIEHKAIYTGNPDAQIELAISAGTFGEIWDADASKEDLTPIIGNITGGTFASDPTPYVADNYKGTQSNGSWTVSKKSSSSGGSGSSAVTELDKVKAEANTALSNAAAANKYDDAEQAEVKSILEKAAADIKAAKTEDEVKAIKEAAQAEIDKVLTSEEKAEIEAVAGVSSDIFKAKSKLTKLNSKKAIKVTWNVPGSMKLDGYEVFRSTKRYSGFGTEPYFTTSKTSYTNNKELKTGKTYYYKVRGFVEINGERIYTGFSTKAFRTIK